MNMKTISQNLQNQQWKKIGTNNHLGVTFDLVMHWHNTLGAYWFALFKAIPILDDNAAMIWQTHFENIKAQSKPSLFKSGQPFLLCLIAGKVQQKGLSLLKSDDFATNSRALGLFLVVDTENKLIHGLCPTSPIDARKHCNTVKNTLQTMF